MNATNITVVNTRSENDVVNSSDTATAKIASSPPAKIPYLPATLALLSNFSIESEIETRNAALAVQISNNQKFYQYRDIVENLVKGMIDEINRNIKLGPHPFFSGFKGSDREYYGISFEDNKYPDMSTYPKLRKVVKEMIGGDKKRILGGGPVLKAFPWQTLDTWNNLLKTKFDLKGNTFNETKDAQKAVTAKVKEYNEIIYPEMKADTTHFYRNIPKETYHDLAAEFGILFRHYGSDPNIFGYAFGVASNDGVPLKDAEVTIEGTELKIHTNQSGFWSTNQIKLGLNKITCKKFPFDDIVLENIDIKQGIEEEVNFKFISEDESEIDE